MPGCVSRRAWPGLVRNLEAHAGLAEGPDNVNLIQRAFHALQLLREDGVSIASTLRESLFRKTAAGEDTGRTLAQLYWPMICTTNYDDIYLIARMIASAGKPGDSDDACRYQPRGLVRSDADFHELLEQLTFPTSEVN